LFPDEVNFVRTTSVSTTHISGRFQYTANGGNASNDQIYVGQTDRLILLWCIGKGKKLYATYTHKKYRIPVILTENEYINIAVCETNYFQRARVNDYTTLTTNDVAHFPVTESIDAATRIVCKEAASKQV